MTLKNHKEIIFRDTFTSSRHSYIKTLNSGIYHDAVDAVMCVIDSEINVYRRGDGSFLISLGEKHLLDIFYTQQISRIANFKNANRFILSKKMYVCIISGKML